MSQPKLFDVSPLEGDGQKKRPARRRNAGDRPSSNPQNAASTTASTPDRVVIAEILTGYLAEIDELAPCTRCGITLTDLIRIAVVKGREQWLVQCGWGCMHRYWVDPIPGIMDSGKTDGDEFVMRVGEWKGMTLTEIAGTGNRWVIEAYAEGLAGEATQAAAKTWLAKNP